MVEPAQQLEDLSYGFFPDPTSLDVSWCRVININRPKHISKMMMCNRYWFILVPCLILVPYRDCSLLRALPQLGPAVGRSAWPAVQGRCLEAVTP